MKMTTDHLAEITVEQRIEIGARLKLNVGPPNETLKDPDGRPALKIRDSFGLLIDPKLYAKKRCYNCGGNGTYQITNAKRTGNKRSLDTELRTCACVTSGYQKAQRKLQAAVDEALRASE
jgi:hypothetical protein